MTRLASEPKLPAQSLGGRQKPSANHKGDNSSRYARIDLGESCNIIDHQSLSVNSIVSRGFGLARYKCVWTNSPHDVVLAEESVVACRFDAHMLPNTYTCTYLSRKVCITNV